MMRLITLCLYGLIVVSCSQSRWDQNEQLSECFEQTSVSIKSSTGHYKPYYKFLYTGFLKGLPSGFEGYHESQTEIYLEADRVCTFLENNAIKKSKLKETVVVFNEYVDFLFQYLDTLRHEKVRDELNLYRIDTSKVKKRDSVSCSLLMSDLAMRVRALESIMQHALRSCCIEYYSRPPRPFIFSNSEILKEGDKYEAQIFPGIVGQLHAPLVYVLDGAVVKNENNFLYRKVVNTEGYYKWQGVLVDSLFLSEYLCKVDSFPLFSEYRVY